jgi:hypothetical protein
VPCLPNTLTAKFVNACQTLLIVLCLCTKTQNKDSTPKHNNTQTVSTRRTTYIQSKASRSYTTFTAVVLLRS